jgi:molybdate transport system substrate-binding protein
MVYSPDHAVRATTAAGTRATTHPVIASLQIFAAGSLRPAFDPLGAAVAGDMLAMTYANARELARRIAAGVPADVFASASIEHPQRLHDQGLAGPPRPFTVNRLVVAVARDSPALDATVLAAPGSRVVIEVEGIPLGDYTRTMLALMDGVEGPGFAERALANVVAQEVVVDAVAARILAGDADAGVLYSTDVAARSPDLRAIEIPPSAAVQGTYVACVVAATSQEARATAWIDALHSPSTQAILRDAGFMPVRSSLSRRG